MATPFKVIIESAYATIQDYKLDKILKMDSEIFETIMTTYIIKGKSRFTKCIKDLSVDMEQKVFLSDLDEMEIEIIADYAQIQWFEREIQNILSFNSVLQNNDFKRYSEAQNFKEKQNYLVLLEEKVSQLVTDYKIENKESWIDNFKL